MQKAAPYLTLDSDPYPSVVDGRIVWIVDGYTTSSSYPYSSSVNLPKAISDSVNTAPGFVTDDINYIRNSVKATVDAYDGKVTLYAWDPTDPVLKTWQKIYPSTLKPISDMSAQLMSHVRYPTDMFKVQRAMLGSYHVNDAASFARQDNLWETPNDPQSASANPELQPPYYLSMKMPGQSATQFSMYTTFIPASQGSNSRNVLMGYLSVDSDAGATAGKKSSSYGKLRMLEIDADTTVPGPGQVQNSFDSDPTVGQQLNLLKQGQSKVTHGNLLTLPVGGGFLYVQPVFVQSSGGTQVPRLQKILVAFGDKIAFADTLTEALDELFGGELRSDRGRRQHHADAESHAVSGNDSGHGRHRRDPGRAAGREGRDARPRRRAQGRGSERVRRAGQEAHRRGEPSDPARGEPQHAGEVAPIRALRDPVLGYSLCRGVEQFGSSPGS